MVVQILLLLMPDAVFHGRQEAYSRYMCSLTEGIHERYFHQTKEWKKAYTHSRSRQQKTNDILLLNFYKEFQRYFLHI